MIIAPLLLPMSKVNVASQGAAISSVRGTCVN